MLDSSRVFWIGSGIKRCRADARPPILPLAAPRAAAVALRLKAEHSTVSIVSFASGITRRSC
jgi:hypothetical protein